MKDDLFGVMETCGVSTVSERTIPIATLNCMAKYGCSYIQQLN